MGDPHYLLRRGKALLGAYYRRITAKRQHHASRRALLENHARASQAGAPPLTIPNERQKGLLAVRATVPIRIHHVSMGVTANTGVS